MRVRPSVLLATGVASVLLLSSCGSDSGASSSSSESGGGGGSAEVGVILPDTKSSARWESFDRPLLQEAFDAAGIEADIQNAQGDASNMQTIADQMLTQGVKVLAIVNLDSDSGAAIEAKAKKQGVQTIDYDRLTLGGSADYYVSFDNTVVGEQQGQGLAQCLGPGDKNIVYLNGSPTDNNAGMFSAGAHSVLDPMANYKVVAEQSVPEWDNQQAATIFEQMLTQQGGRIDGVLAANDGLGNAAISILAKNGLAGKVPVTGQDATTQGLQNILAGTQCMTVYKPVDQEAKALADIAIALINGEEPKTTGTVEDSTGGRQVNSVLLEPQLITRDEVKTVVDAGFVEASELCTGEFAAACTELGIS
ncbi:substrate-binding domain-containing protein [Kineococcus sp. T13]|uniref:sugar ABC transporter substrate-binding protein n=1 Tax=Kineococcus vitellinus TaxID=2696565 RepID=UPI001412B0C3|nr:substrate-binding domain-containing protein [Kineococcus vitellinus]NAZ76488.1 substrate-binding domain-containing protein [Kineococcus vitellinus]